MIFMLLDPEPLDNLLKPTYLQNSTLKIADLWRYLNLTSNLAWCQQDLPLNSEHTDGPVRAHGTYSVQRYNEVMSDVRKERYSDIAISQQVSK